MGKMNPNDYRYTPNDMSYFPPQKVFLMNELDANDFFINCPPYLNFKVFVFSEEKMTIQRAETLAQAIEFFREIK
jgi:hypothetical protein